MQHRVLITGGATGIGRATALAFAQRGAAVAINYSRSEKEAQQTADLLRANGAKDVLVHRADVTVDDEVKAMVDTVAKQWGGLDVLVNNAGVTTFVDHADLDALTEEHWDQVLSVNVKGTFFCSRAAAQVMQRKQGGSIVNVASIAGLTGKGSSIAYCASKAALISITKSLARALAPDIRVNAVAPGFIYTRRHAGREGAKEARSKSLPLRRVGTPEDIAVVILAVALDFGFVTGEVVVADGGDLIS